MGTNPSVDPWDRFGAWIAAPWLIFLAFPVVGVWSSDRPIGMKLAGTVLVVLFAVVYVRGFRSIDLERSADLGHPSVRLLLVLVGLVLVAGWPMGLAALGMAPFLTSYANFNLPIRGAIGFDLACIGATLAVIVLAGQFGDSWFFPILVASVAGGTGVVRFVEMLSIRHRAFDDQIVAGEERVRIARDVHDVLGHSLTVVALKAELCARLLESVEPTAESEPALAKARAELAELHTTTRSALADVRTTVGGLRVADLESELTAGLGALDDAGVSAQVRGEVAEVGLDARPVFAWALREAVTNIVRHAGATEVEIEIGPRSLRVSDDGRGITPEEGERGLIGLRQRVDAAGGRLRVESLAQGSAVGPGGTVLEIELS